jgi:hypothetical protein
MQALYELLDRRGMTWWDVVDILIVSLLIYEALKLIRGTRAVQMALGSALVLLLFYVSQLFPLQTVSWLIRNLLVYVVFAAIVLFQSDIRRALSHFGSAPFFRYLSRAERAADTIEEVVTAAGMLSDTRHRRGPALCDDGEASHRGSTAGDPAARAGYPSGGRAPRQRHCERQPRSARDHGGDSDHRGLLRIVQQATVQRRRPGGASLPQRAVGD